MNEIKSIETEIQLAIEQFQQHLKIASLSIVEACKVYVATVDKSPDAKQLFVDSFPSVSASAWKRYELIGRGQILPEIAANPIKFSDKPIEKFPISDQQRLVVGTIEVMNLEGNDSIYVSYANMSNEQKRIAFSSDHIRSVPEQRALIEKERSERLKESLKKQTDTTEDIRNECLKMLLDKTITSTKMLSVRKILRGE